MAKRIKELRTAKGLTLEQVADVVGVGKSTVRKWETGMIANMRRDKIASLATALGTTPAYLMGWKEEPETKKDSPKEEQKNDYKARKQEAARLRKLENDTKKAEEKIALLEEEIESLNNTLLSDEIATDYIKAAEISDKITALQKELDETYAVWEELMIEN